MSFHEIILGLVISLIASYPIELEIKDTTDTDRSASYLDLHLDFNFPIVNFPFICSKIPAAPAYGVYKKKCISLS